MHVLMIRLLFVIALGFGALAPGLASADAALSSRLGLDVEQSRSLAAIEAKYRRDFASVRQEHNREARALRRAKLANDAAETARLESVVESLRSKLEGMREAQDDRIVALLRADQKSRFDAFVAERRQMHGSSRDERLFD